MTAPRRKRGLSQWHGFRGRLTRVGSKQMYRSIARSRAGDDRNFPFRAHSRHPSCALKWLTLRRVTSLLNVKTDRLLILRIGEAIPTLSCGMFLRMLVFKGIIKKLIQAPRVNSALGSSTFLYESIHDALRAARVSACSRPNAQAAGPF
jgi:hypothetical protein